MRKIKRVLQTVLVFTLCFGMLATNMSTYAWAAEYADDSDAIESTVSDTAADSETEEIPVNDDTEAVSTETAAETEKEAVPVSEADVPETEGTVNVPEASETQAASLDAGMMPLAVADTDVAKIGDNGYATLEDAIEAAANGDTIELLADVTLAASTTISHSITIQPAEGKTVTIHRGAFQPAMFKVTKATLTLNGNLTLDGAKSDGSASYGSIVLCEKGTAAVPSALIMNEGVTLQNNTHSNSLYGGAVSLNGAASFTMNGGTITNCGVTSVANKGKYDSAGGGAVRMANTTAGTAVMVMNGGTISDCFGIVGGAVFVTNNYANGLASVTMNGGMISGCIAGRAKTTVDGWGGAFFIYNKAKANAANTTVTINGGTITGCKAYQYGTLGMNGGVSSNPYNGGKYVILGGHIYGNAVGYGGNWDGSPGQWYGQGVHVQSVSYTGESLLTIGGSAVIEDEIYIAKTNNFINIRDDFSGSAKIYAGGYGTKTSDGTGAVIAKAISSDGSASVATSEIAGKVAVTNGKFDSTGSYVRDENGNIVPRYGVIVDPDNTNQYILGEPVPAVTKYTVTYTDGVDGEEVFADQVYTVEDGAETPVFQGEPKRVGYVFNGWNPEVAETVTADATYTAQWAVCEHVWSEPVFDEDALTYTYTCSVCGETKVVNVAAKIESTGEYYESLQAAMDAAKAIMIDADHENQTIILLTDVTESTTLTWVKGLKVANNFNLTIDLAGHTVTGNGSSVMAFSASGSGGAKYRMNITIDDSSADKTGTITGGTGKGSSSTTYGGAIHITGKSGDSLIINGGNFKNNTAAGGGAIYCSTVGLNVIINGGTFTGNTAVGGSGGAISAPTVTVNGGVITGNSVTGTATFTGRGGGICVWTTTGSLIVTGGQIYGNTAERYGDDIVFGSTSTAAVSSPSMKLVNAADMGVEGISGWYVDGYNGAFTSEANKTERYSADYIEAFESYADFSGKAARGKAIALKAAEGVTYTVTYTDGVEGEELFADQVYTVGAGKATPAFDGTPKREGYTFAGWTPEVTETVTGNAIYTATWVPAKPDWLGMNVTDEFVKFVCDTDPDHHDDVVVKWVANYTRAISDPVWDEELGTWTADVRLEAIDTMYLWMNYEKKVGVDHDLVADKPVPAGKDSYEVTMKWDAETKQWVHLDGQPLVFHVSCQTAPILPGTISGYQVKMVDANGVLANWFVNVKVDSYEFGEIQGSREEGFTVDVTFHFTEDDEYMTSWAANRGTGYHYDRTQTDESYTVTLTYAGSLTGTLSSGPWQFNGMTNKGTIATVYVTNKYTVTLDANGGNVAPDTITVTYDTAIGEIPVPERVGYTFNGWTDADGNAVTAETVYTTAGDTTLTAQWIAAKYTITLDTADGKPSETIEATYDSPIGELPTPVRDGYTFEGWYDADGNLVTAETVYKIAGDTKLTAKWSKNAVVKPGDDKNDPAKPTDKNDKPDKNNKPSKTDKPNKVNKTDKNNVKTGDFTPVTMYVSVMLLSTMVIAVFFAIQRRRRNH